MLRIPTDLEMLNAIYERYYGNFALDSVTEPTRDTKIYVPIDCRAIAQQLGVDGDIVFGRLYYDLEKRYGYKQSDNSWVHFFALKVGSNRHAIHFPYLASVVAQLRAERRRNLTATVIAIISLIIACCSLAVAFYRALEGAT